MANIISITVFSAAARTYRCLHDERPTSVVFRTDDGRRSTIDIPAFAPDGARNTLDKVFRVVVPFHFTLQGQRINGPMEGSVTVERTYAPPSPVGNGHREGA